MRKLLFTLSLLFALAQSAGAVDLAAAFGVNGAPLGVDPASKDCHFQAVHAGNASLGSVIITANGIDSAVITLLCNGVSVTSSIPSIDVNGHSVATVAFPQTVTSSAAGIWTVTVAGKIQFTVTAQ